MPTPTVNCGNATNTSLSFFWPSTLGVQAYEVSINGGGFTTPSSGILGTLHALSGLSPGDSATISVRAIGQIACGNSSWSDSITCYTIPCTVDSFIPSANQQICQGQSIDINISNISATNYSVEWNGINYGATSTLSVSPSTTTTYDVTVIDSSQLVCPMPTYPIEIIVNPIPTVTLFSSLVNDSICFGDTSYFSAQPTGYDTYTFRNGVSILQSGPNPDFSFSAQNSSSNITVSATSLGCSSPYSAPLAMHVIEPIAAPIVNCGTSTNTSIQFIWNAIAGAIGYEIKVDNGNWTTPSSGVYGLTHVLAGLNPGEAHTLVVRALGAAPCGNSPISYPATCIAIPCNPNTFSTSNDQSLCEGFSATLSAFNFSSTNFSISWDGFQYSTQTSYQNTYFQDTTIVVFMLDSNQIVCPAAHKTIGVDVEPLPQVNLIGLPSSGSICVGEAITINAFPFGYDIYRFYNKSLSLQSNAANTFNTTNQLFLDSIYVVAENKSCIGDTSNLISFMVSEPLQTPTINCGTTNNTFVNFQWNAIPGATGYEVSINSGNFTSSTSLLGQYVGGLLPGDTVRLRVVATGLPPCGDSEISLEQHCIALPCTPINFITEPAFTLCEGQQLSLEIDSITTVAFSSSWNGQNIGQQTQLTFSPIQDTTILITLIDSNQLACPGPTKQVNVQVVPTPNATLSVISGSDTICAGEQLMLEALPSGYDNYLFYEGFVAIQNGPNNQFVTSTATNGKTYTVVPSSFGCIGQTSNQKTITVDQPLVQPTVYCGQTTNTSIQFEWDPVPGATGYQVAVGNTSFFTPSSGISGLSHFIGSLSPNDSAYIQVLALGNQPCGDGIASLPITCKAIPCTPINFDLSSDSAICDGEIATVTIQNVTTPNYQVLWNNIPSSVTTVAFSPNMDTTIFVAIKDLNQPVCPSPIKTTTIEVIPIPQVTINLNAPSNTLCEGAQISVSASPAGLSQYQYYVNYQLVQSTGNHIYTTSTLENNDIISVVANDFGCSAPVSNSIQVTVESPLETPQVNCGTSTNSTIEFVWDNVNNSAGYQVSINGNLLVVPSSGTSGLSHLLTGLAPSDSAAIEVIALGQAPCGNSIISMPVTCFATPCSLINFVRTPNDTLCAGQSVAVEIDAITTNNYTTIWNGIALGSTTSQTLVTTQDTAISIQLIDNNQPLCPAVTKTTFIKVNPIPVVILASNTSNDSLCTDAGLSFTASPQSFDHYIFTAGQGVVQSSAVPYLTPPFWANNKPTSVVAIDKGCESQPSNTVTVHIGTPLATPQVNCNGSTNTSISFAWQPIVGATGYLVSINGGQFVVPSSGNNGTVHVVSGVAPGSTATCIVVAIGEEPCGNSAQSMPVTCTAIPCTAISFSPSSNSPVCEMNQISLAIDSISTTNYQVTWANNTPNTALTFDLLAVQDTSISVQIKNLDEPACPSVSYSFFAAVVPLPSISLTSNSATDTICENDLVSIAANFTFYDQIDFLRGYATVQSSNSAFYSTSAWLNGDSIVAFAVQDGCVGPISNPIKLSVNQPLTTPEIYCGNSNNTSTSANWYSIPSALGYEISINQNPVAITPSSGISGLSHLVSGLSPGDSIQFAVRAFGSQPCGGSAWSDTITCYAINCIGVSFDDTPDTVICAQTAIELSISNLSPSNYSIYWQGQLQNVFSQTFTPTTDTTLVVQVADNTQPVCPISTRTMTVEVNPIPSVSLTSNTTNDSACTDAGLQFIAAPLGYDQYTFTSDLAILQSGTSPFLIPPFWPTNKAVTVTAIDLNCTSLPSNSVTIYVAEPLPTPQINCNGSTNTSVSFSWGTISGATGYLVSVNGGAFVTPSSGSTGTVHSVLGLAPGTAVSCAVIALGDAPCGNSALSNTITCTAIPCTAINFQANQSISACDFSPLTLSINAISISNPQLSWAGSTAAFITSKSFIAHADTTILVTIANPAEPVCPIVSHTFFVTVNPLPQISLSSNIIGDSICLGDPVVIAASFPFYDQIDFMRGYLNVQSNSSSIYTTTQWISGDSIYAIATNNGCAGPPSNAIKLFVDQPLATPDINCGNSNNTFTSASWYGVTGALGYEVSLDFGQTAQVPSSGNMGLLHLISSLSPGDSISFRVRALGTQPCGSSQWSDTVTCYAFPCMAVTFDRSADTTVCAGTPITASISNLSTNNISIYWNGNLQNVLLQQLQPITDTTLSVLVKDNTQPVCPGTLRNFTFETIAIPTVNLSSNISGDSVCAGSPIEFIASPTGYDSYQFFNNSQLVQDSVYPYFSTTSLTGANALQVISNDLGCADTSNIIVPTILQLPVFSLSTNANNDSLCTNEDLVVTVLPSTYNTYQFYDGIQLIESGNSNVFTQSPLGHNFDLTVIVSDILGCADTSALIPIIAMPLPAISLNASQLDSICRFDYVTFTASPASEARYLFYNQNNTLLQDSTLSTYTTDSILNGDRIYVVAENALGCRNASVDTLSFVVFPTPTVTISADTAMACFNTAAALNAQSDYPQVTIDWSLGLSGNGIAYIFTQNQYVTATCALGACTSRADSVYIIVDTEIPTAFAGDNQVICKQTSTTLAASGGDNYYWFSGENIATPDSISTEVSPTDTTVYWVRVYLGACFSEDSLTVYIDRCLDDLPEPIPNVFTPNGDSKNEVFYIQDIDYFRNNSLTIYNRWGAEVYSKQYYLNEWEGQSNNGNRLPDGTYYYILDIGNGKVPPYTGFILLHR